MVQCATSIGNVEVDDNESCASFAGWLTDPSEIGGGGGGQVYIMYLSSGD